LTLNVLILALVASGCGQVTTRPTVLVPTATRTQTPTSTSTPRATATPAPYTPAPTATATVTPTPIVHAIARGETLLAIANKYGVSVAAIQEVNASILLLA
jgi:LysM repeat protein